ncbi:hypothetical protein JZ751_002097 [Albula glossodonta]|uniref:THAP-type domain-containing protein n=1 Tax=Albula glossodonta TaxID=121402 RepID=A0A8T2PFF1_9TELE|nr:hypothetical protein JZ751_002097 [Albula glossodonta]
MPKYCTAPNCKNDAKNSDRKSFYKFPLHDSARLKQWLKNMGREDWTPSRHQHLCHDHFTPACFTLRWGIRYLANDAKRKGGDRSERNPKRQRNCGRRFIRTMPTVEVSTSDSMCQDRDANMVQLYAITVDASQPGQSVLLDAGNMGHTMGTVQTAMPLPVVDGQVGSVSELPVTLFQRVEDLGEAGEGEQHAEVVVVSEGPTVDMEDQEKEEVLGGITGALLVDSQDVAVNVNDGSSLTIENVALEMAEPSAVQDDRGVQIIAYFETIPNVLPATSATQPCPMPDTVLSSALSSKPIVSTLPIVSKHLPPSAGSLVLTLERLESMEKNGGKEAENSLSKEQLEAIVIELQKKVKVLQQRHRRHLDKLLGLESTVSQLRHSNLVNEERLRLLEKAYVQTSAAVSDVGETVAIICEDESTAYLYALPKSDVEMEAD